VRVGLGYGLIRTIRGGWNGSVGRNPLIGAGLADGSGVEGGAIRHDPAAAQALFARCPVADVTPLLSRPDLAKHYGVASVLIKDERSRMGLGSFKALGAAHAIAKLAFARRGERIGTAYSDALADMTFVCASAGNHGLSMAAGARVFGAKAVVYIAETVPEAFASELRGRGADVVRKGQNYETSMAVAREAAQDNGWYLLSDSTWCGYREPALDVMEGYLIMAAEVVAQTETAPSHIFLQAGVGGLAAACAAVARDNWGAGLKICIVEPVAAPALVDSVLAGGPVNTGGPVSNMGRLDCKEPSHLALKYLAEHADYFMTIGEEEAEAAVAVLAGHDLVTTPSGAAGFAGFARADCAALGIDAASRVLVYLSEGVPVERA